MISETTKGRRDIEIQKIKKFGEGAHSEAGISRILKTKIEAKE